MYMYVCTYALHSRIVTGYNPTFKLPIKCVLFAYGCNQGGMQPLGCHGDYIGVFAQMAHSVLSAILLIPQKLFTDSGPTCHT